MSLLSILLLNVYNSKKKTPVLHNTVFSTDEKGDHSKILTN